MSEPVPVSGITCPNCSGGRLLIFKTKHAGRLTIRHRKCPGCPYRVETRETVRAVLPPPKKSG
ncbi:MAG: hypothetical protein C0501_17490 [Isosphaera sp.]|nr:hypothetical protein [Isosphaera sp.]